MNYIVIFLFIVLALLASVCCVIFAMVESYYRDLTNTYAFFVFLLTMKYVERVGE